MHIAEALESIDYTDSDRHTSSLPLGQEQHPTRLITVARQIGQVRPLVSCSHFDVVHVTGAGERVNLAASNPVVMLVLSGTGQIGNAKDEQWRCDLRPGDTVLIPALAETFIELTPAGQMLLTCLGTE